MIRILLADDHTLVRNGIRALLEKNDEIKIVGEAADGLEAFEKVCKLTPDVLIMDIGMPRLNGIQTLERIQSDGLKTRVVILSMHANAMLVRQALNRGACGYLLKHSVSEELYLSVRAAYRNEHYLSPPVSDIVMKDYLNFCADEGGAANPIEQLTSRQREVLQLIAEGSTNSMIADALHISLSTVEKHRSNLMSRLDAHDVAELIRIAIKYGLIFIDD
ncbi:MAG: response regulator transcription factor [Anaerolineales bacterium]